MKKIYLFLGSAVLASSTFAQAPVANQAETFQGFSTLEEVAMPVYGRTQRSIDNFVKEKSYSPVLNSKGAVSGYVDHASYLYNALTSSLMEYALANPVMPDSTTTTTFTSTTINNRTHAWGMIYDPVSSANGAVQFGSGDVVNVDSIFIDGLYFYNDNTDNNDSIIVTVVADLPGPGGATAFYNLPPTFTGLSDTCAATHFFYTGSASHGQHDGLDGPITARYGYQLSFNDTTGGVNSFGIQTTGLQVPAGNILGIWVEFKPTPGGWTQGDNTDLTTGTGAYNAFRPLVVLGTGSSQTMYNFFSTVEGPTQSWQHNGIFLTNRARYNATSQTNIDVGGGYITSTWFGYSVWMKVSGNSSVSVEELRASAEYSVYPNPSNGEFNININAETKGNVNLTVRNVVGQTVISKTIAVSGQTRETVSLANHSKGIYFLTVGDKTTKLIVE